MSTPRRPYRPPAAVDRLTNRLLLLFRWGPTLAVRGRKTGKWYTMPVWPLDHGGKRYLVAPRGNTHWARNLRASGEGEIRQGRRVQPFMAVELPAEQAEPIVKLYVDRYGRRYGRRYGGFVAHEFEQMPDSNDHPVFRLDLQEHK